MACLFGTDGVRGVVQQELTAELACSVAQAAVQCLSLQGKRVLIARDTRRSGEMLEAAMAAGFCAAGAEPVLLGIVPTPAVAYACRKQKSAGVMISASHNSAEYNGIKLFGCDGMKLPDEMEDRIEAAMREAPCRCPPEEIAVIRAMEAASADYIAHLQSTAPQLRPMHIVLDCANGAVSHLAPALFRSLGMQVDVIANQPDGLNINLACGSTAPEELAQAVVAQKADAGFAFDGDADRLIAIDERGGVIDGDAILYICALRLQKAGRLHGHAIAATVMSNMGLELALKKHGITVVRTAVGDRCVMEAMQAQSLALGGEQSGHIVFSDYAKAGDGMLTAIQLLAAMSGSDAPLSGLASGLHYLPQVQCSARVLPAGRQRAMRDPAVLGMIAALEEKYASSGRILVRPSGTEPSVRIMIEADDRNQAKEDAMRLKRLIEQCGQGE